MGRSARSVLGTLLVLAFSLPAALPVLAQESETSIGGTLTRPEGEERVPVEGAIFVVTENGTEIGTGTSGPDGVWEVPLPGAGEYDVTGRQSAGRGGAIRNGSSSPASACGKANLAR